VPDPLALNTADGASRVTIADPTGSPIIANLVEIGPSQAVIDTDVEFEPNAYLDLTLELKGQPPRKFFAHVVAPDPKGVRIRWMHLDPGEEQKLKGLLAAYARTQAGAAAAPGHGTRRVIRPKSETFTPFGASGTDVEVQLPPGAPSAPAPPAAPPTEHRPSRRIIKAGPKADIQSSEHEPTASDTSDDSKGRPVVIATTDKFEKLRHIEDAKPIDATPASTAALPGNDAPHGDSFPDNQDVQTPTKTIGKDGRMDVGAAIRSKAKTVRASELAARHDKVRVLNMATIKSLIQDAVSEAAAHLTRALGEAERKRLLEEAEEGFKERLKAFEIDKKSAEEKARLLQNELNAATELLDQERKRSIAADQFTVSEAGLAEIDVRMAKVIERAVSRGDAGPELELKLREMISGILDSERERMREKELAAHNDKIALLEKKVARLAHSLDSTEKERDEARQIAEAMEKHGISAAEVKNKYKIGISGDDPNRERKMALMRELMEQNRELRKALGIKMKTPEEAAKEAAEEAAKKRAEAEQAKREVLEDRAAATADAEPAPAAVTEPAVEPVAEDPAENDAPTEPGIDPDDQPWEPTAKAVPQTQEDDRGVKVLRDFKRFEPPPLESSAATATDAAEDGTEVQVDPDDLPWEAAPAATTLDDAPSAIKRIVTKPPGS
jgi:hypothetical protein